MLSVSLLGDFRIQHDGVPVTGLDAPRLQSLLAYLVVHRTAPQSRAYLAFLFWPDTTEAQARTNLRYLLHQLRHALPNADSYLDANAQTLQWRPGEPLALDVAGFEAALGHADQVQRMGDPAAAREALEQAVDLYTGDLLPSCYDDWILPERERLRQVYLDALARLARVQEEQRDYRAAIQSAQRLLRHDPLHEATYRDLMRLQALDGDRAGALRTYHTCATVLQRELGVKPSAATREVYEQLLGAEAQPYAEVPATSALVPLVGREKEWAQMQRAWRAAAAGAGPHALVLRGEAGIGKTRLTEELFQWAARQGIVCANARCYAAEGQLAYAPVTAWLRAHPLPPLEDVWLAEVARLLPEVLTGRPDLPRPAAMTEVWQRERLFEGLARAVLGTGRPLLLTIDDLQWCDPDTLEWLHFLLRFDRAGRLLVTGTYRTEEVGDDHPLLHLLQALRLQGQVTEVELGPLDEASTHTLAERVAGRELDPEVTQLLYRETEGNPLYVVEAVRAGLPLRGREPRAEADAMPPRKSLPGDAGIPPKVRSMLEARLAQLSPSTRELAGLAAAIGREFGFDLLVRASGRGEEALVRELDELWQRRIVRERGASGYDFSHGKLREVAYDGLSAARRRLLHRAIAQALEALHAPDPDPVSYQVAAHYERAGLPDRAVPYYLRAAEVGRRVFANEEAIALLRRGLALVEDARLAAGAEASHEVAACLWEALGDLLALKEDHEEALQAFQNALERVDRSNRICQARLYRKMSTVHEAQRLYTEALDACRRAEAALGEPPGEDADPWWDEWTEVQVRQVWAQYWLADWPTMEELVTRVQPVVQKRGDTGSRMRFLFAATIMRLRKYRYTISDEMLADQREALAASQEAGSPMARCENQFELGFLYLFRRELNEAEENLQAALALAETYGAARMRTLSLTYLTIVRRFRGLEDEVRRCALRAQETAQAAHMPDYVAVAQANQAWLAWRVRDLPAAEQLGRDAVALWRQSPLAYPFQWQALWPLMGVALARGREEEAWPHVQALLEPKQQRLPDDLNTALEAALREKETGQAATARAHLDRAVELAGKMGYL